MFKRIPYILIPVLCLVFLVSIGPAGVAGETTGGFPTWGPGTTGGIVLPVIDALRDSGVFVSQIYNLSIDTQGQGQVTVDGDPYADTIEYGEQTVVELEATAEIGWYFNRWERHLTGSETPVAFLVDGIKVVDAVFERATGDLIYEKQMDDEVNENTGWIRSLNFSNDGQFLGVGARGSSGDR